MTNITYAQIVNNINDANMDSSLLYIVLFLVEEKIIPLQQNVTRIKKKFSFKNKYNKEVFNIAKNIFFYNSEKLIKDSINSESEIPFELIQFNDNLTILQNLQNLISYNEHIGDNNLIDVIVPMCKTEPEITKSEICDCDSFNYNELTRKKMNEKYNNILPILPAGRGIIKYLNALLGVICLIDSRDKVIDHNIFFEAIQTDLHSNNETEINEKYSLYDSINIDFEIFLNKLNETYGRNEHSNIVEEKERKMFDYVKKIKKLVKEFERKKIKILKSKKRNDLFVQKSLNNQSNFCDEEDIWSYKCNNSEIKKSGFFRRKKPSQKNRYNNCLIASEYKKKCRKYNASKKNGRNNSKMRNLEKCIRKLTNKNSPKYNSANFNNLPLNHGDISNQLKQLSSPSPLLSPSSPSSPLLSPSSPLSTPISPSSPSTLNLFNMAPDYDIGNH